MTDDATTVLRQRMLSQIDQPTAQSISDGPSPDDITKITALFGTAANYAQVFSTAEGPIAQAAAIAYVKSLNLVQGTATGLETAAGQAAIITAGAAAAGIGAGIVLIFAFALAALASTSDSGSAQTEFLQKLGQAISDLQQDFDAVDLGGYWYNLWGELNSAWNSGQSGIGVDLDNLAEEGIGQDATDVQLDAPHFHDHALGFVMRMVQQLGPNPYWVRPVLANQGFAAQMVAYPSYEGFPGDGFGVALTTIMGWYGSLPQPEPATLPQGGQGASDPRTMLSCLAVGMNSWITVQMLVHLIDPSLQTFDQFLDDFSGNYTVAGDQKNIPAFTRFLFSQYFKAVTNIIMSDLPTMGDLVSFLIGTAGTSGYYLTAMGYSPPALGPSWSSDSNVPPSAGYAWNGVYGAVDTYPAYGYYSPGPPLPVPFATPAYVIDSLWQDAAENLQGQWAELAQYEYEFNFFVGQWVVPWLQNRIVLGRLARWKAIYLLNGYDQVWSILQKLEIVAKPSTPIVPAELVYINLLHPGEEFIADGNWHMRELFAIMNFDGLIGGRIPGDELPYSQEAQGYSLWALVQALDDIANGSWTGPPGYPFPGNPPSWGEGPAPRPLSFRGRLAAAATSIPAYN
jgi:hypothetical protein